VRAEGFSTAGACGAHGHTVIPDRRSAQITPDGAAMPRAVAVVATISDDDDDAATRSPIAGDDHRR
jgi:hypothetical protein